MRIAGIDVGRRYDKTACIIQSDNIIERCMQLGAIRFREQAQFLYPILKNCDMILIDISGLGIGLCEILQEMKLPVVFVSILFGDNYMIKGDRILTGKQFLSTNLAENLSKLTLGINRHAKHALKEQLANFIVIPGRNPKFQAKSGHDDLVIALALTCLGDTIYDKDRKRFDKLQAAAQQRGSEETRSARS